MTPFLKVVAREYARRYGNELSRICFVFPNKRSGMFFMKYMRDYYGMEHFFIPPQLKTLSSLVEDISGKVVDSQIDLLLQLFNCYKKLLNLPEDDPRAEFDNFRSWGEMVLNDFNDVDTSGANPDEVFMNVEQLREIESYYLDEDQQEVLQEVFGVPIPRKVGEFWRKVYRKPFNKEVKESDGQDEPINVRGHFMRLWEIMQPLYHEFNKVLESRGLTYQGAAYRKALVIIEDKNSGYRYADKYVFIGFYNLSKLEKRMFSLLARRNTILGVAEEPMADFVWDFTGAINLNPDNDEMKFMRELIDEFPKPQWLDLGDSESHALPKVLEIVAAPSNTMQVKEIGNILAEMQADDKGDKAFNNADVAVVLPDEGLLMPLIYSLPEDKDGNGMSVNLTMGYPLKLTATMSLIGILRRLQRNSSGSKISGPTFYHSDIRAVIAHPLVNILISESESEKLRRYLKYSHKASIPARDLVALAPGLDMFLTRVNMSGIYREAYDYLNKILSTIYDALGENKMERDHIEVYRDALRRLCRSLDTQNVNIKGATLMLLADRMLAGQHVSFIGEPITGLQIVGFLETRCLDFERIIIPSMNERILPKRFRMRSFIPMNIRAAYGLPTNTEMERGYNYLFYRMISRAKEVRMLYDSVSSKRKNGDVSRYVLQLQYLYAKGLMKQRELRYEISTMVKEPKSIVKGDYEMEQLSRYFSGGSENKKNLSPTKLQKYVSCPLRFYFSQVLDMADDPEPSDFLTSIDTGNIVHEVMSRVYTPNDELRDKYLENGVRVTTELIDEYLADDSKKLREKLNNCIVNYVNKGYNRDKSKADFSEQEGDIVLMADSLLRQLETILKHDREHAPFIFHGTEVDQNLAYTPEGGKPVNFKFVVDRIDEINIDGVETMRIVDYKTGKAHMATCKVEDLFDTTTEKSHNSHNLFQLMVYALMMRQNNPAIAPEGYALTIYSPLENPVGVIPALKVDGERNGRPIKRHTEIVDEFKKRFDMLINEIFNPEIPFTATCNPKACERCNFRANCEILK